ncbi:26S proteasome non-ATPase regulatory subunit 9 [Blastomyces parvus]|uniref:Probable 26S proteasome regulatory subunit p27 n=1 Tax=Blastomyces parvus TaxID=2060905 RepID=A0A2B7X6K1_9EURO|nr:26S proteasome non-ATPase regulatory subunit 9 [Blastomyces parvus]
MGIPMDNIHTPTVASGPTSGPARNGRELSSLSLNELREEKVRLEAELKELSAVLDSHGVNMSTSLTTFDGYPRDDLDIAQIRTTRARIIYLRNDYKDLMGRIEQRVHDRFAQLQEQQQQNTNCPPTTTTSSTSTSTTSPSTSSTPAGLIETPFAKVNRVIDGSPAAQAGIKEGDTIRSVGHVNWMNHEELSKVLDVVHQNEGKPVLVKLVRKDESGERKDLTVQLIPRQNWGGRGSLGCFITII